MRKTDLRPGMVVAARDYGKAELGHYYLDRCIVLDVSQPWRTGPRYSTIRYEPGARSSYGRQKEATYALAKETSSGEWVPMTAPARSIAGTWDDHLAEAERLDRRRVEERERRISNDTRAQQWARSTTERLAALGIQQKAYMHQYTDGVKLAGDNLERLLSLAEAGAGSGGSRDAFLAAYVESEAAS